MTFISFIAGFLAGIGCLMLGSFLAKDERQRHRPISSLWDVNRMDKELEKVERRAIKCQ